MRLLNGGGTVLVFRKNRPSAIARDDTEAGDRAEARFGDILGSCSRIAEAIELGRKFARVRNNVLIVGETGTGKDLFAQAMHNERCPGGPFVPINCAAIPSAHTEGYLFGYEAGAFGADPGGRPGAIELAEGGTLYLDEIGNLSPSVQAVLLRVLEDKKVMRLGGRAYHRIDCKMLSSTNRDIASLVERGTFREDLLHRLSALTIELPPLRDRGSDKLLYARHFLDECRKENPAGPTSFSRKAEAVLSGYSWPGNLREMKNVVTRAFLTASGDAIQPDDFPLQVHGLTGRTTVSDIGLRASAEDGISQVPPLHVLEKRAVVLALKSTYGNVDEASKMLGVSRSTLYRRIRQYRLT